MSTTTWYSIFDFSFDYKGIEPSYIDPATQRWTADFEANFESIRAELYHYLENHQLQAYFNSAMVNNAKSWKTISLRWWDVQFAKNQQFFPKTMEIVNRYPEILSLSFNQLDAHGKILAHCGDTNAMYRCHLGIKIPTTLPTTGFRVRDEKRSWEEGKWLIFMDAYNHEAWNDSDENRIIMVIDVLRPEWKNQRGKITSTVMSSLFLQKRAEMLPFLKKAPIWLIKLLAFSLRPFAWLAIRTVNFLRFY